MAEGRGEGVNTPMTPPPFPFLPKADYLAHKAEIDEAIARTLDSGWYILGQEVSGFEREFAEFLGVSRVLGVASGTDALELALRACDLSTGDAVATVSHTAVATVAAIERAGLTPLLVDIDPVTYTMDPARLEEAIRGCTDLRVRAVLPVHLYGHPANMPAIMEIARRHGLYVIEDCAQSHGARLDGRTTGTWGDLAAFSFYPTKNLGAIGDGGAVATDRADLAERVDLLRQYGWRDQPRYVSQVPGINSRLDEIQAAILRVKLRHLEADNRRRRQLASLYSDGLASTSLTAPAVREGAEHVFHLYVIRSGNRDGLMAYLKEKGIPTAIHYPAPVHLQPAYEGRIAVGKGGLGETERACREILSLPLHPHLTEVAILNAVEQLKAWKDG